MPRKKLLNTYKITNTETGEIREVESEFLGSAVESLNWDISKCRSEIIPTRPGRKPKKQEPVTDENQVVENPVTETVPAEEPTETPVEDVPVDETTDDIPVDEIPDYDGPDFTDDDETGNSPVEEPVSEPETEPVDSGGGVAEIDSPIANLCDSCIHQQEYPDCEGNPKFASELKEGLTGAEADAIVTCHGFEQKPEMPVSQELVDRLRKQHEDDQHDTEVEKEIAKEVDSIPEPNPHVPLDNASQDEKDAYQHMKDIQVFALEAQIMFLKIGQLLYNAREKGEWTILRYETFKDYIVDLDLPMQNSYSWSTRLMNIYEYMVKEMGLDEKLLAEIGVAKLTRLLPLARRHKLTMEVIEAAKVLSDLDLRETLGHNVGGGSSDEPDLIICPRCGEQIDAKKATRVE